MYRHLAYLVGGAICSTRRRYTSSHYQVWTFLESSSSSLELLFVVQISCPGSVALSASLQPAENTHDQACQRRNTRDYSKNVVCFSAMILCMSHIASNLSSVM